MIKELRQEFLKAASSNNIRSVGEAFYNFQQKYPEIDLYSDLRHPSRGTYLAAAVVLQVY